MKNLALTAALALTLAACNKENTPKDADKATQYQLTKLELLNHPMDADLASNPDIFIVVTDKNANPIYTTSYVADAYNPSFDISLTLNKTELYFIELWDYDSLDPNDFIGSIAIVPEDALFNTVPPLYFSSGGISLNLHGSWK